MHHSGKIGGVTALAAAVALIVAMAPPTPQAPFTTDFGFEDGSALGPNGGNRYFSLRPGAFQRLEGEDDGQFVEVEVTVLDDVRAIPFIAKGELIVAVARVIEEREWTEGELAQVSLNYYASCEKTGNVYYLGESVDHYENGEIISHEDTWLAGENGAMPGLMMPQLFLLGSRYQMEQAPGVSMDRGENLAMGRRFQTPAGTFRNCVVVRETSPLEPEEETLKIYAPGIGLVADGDLLLVDHHE